MDRPEPQRQAHAAPEELGTQKKRRRRPKRPSNKLQHVPHPSAAGWSIVTRGSRRPPPPSESQSTAEPLSAAAAASQADSASDSETSPDPERRASTSSGHPPTEKLSMYDGPFPLDPDVTLSTLRAEYTLCQTRWLASSVRSDLRSVLARIPRASPAWSLSAAVVLALGSFSSSAWELSMGSSAGRSSVSLTQLAAFEDCIEVLRGRGHCLQQKAAQDPLFTGLDEVFLAELGYRVLKRPAAEAWGRRDVLAFIPHGPGDASAALLRRRWQGDQRGDGEEERGERVGKEAEAEEQEKKKEEKDGSSSEQRAERKEHGEATVGARATQSSRDNGRQGPGVYLGNDLREEHGLYGLGEGDQGQSEQVQNRPEQQQQDSATPPAMKGRKGKGSARPPPPPTPSQLWAQSWLALRNSSGLEHGGRGTSFGMDEWLMFGICVYWLTEDEARGGTEGAGDEEDREGDETDR